MKLSDTASSSFNTAIALANNELPKISVIVPFYNQYGFVAEAVQSVLDQGYSNLEVIVVDDGSTGDPLDWIIEMGECIQLIKQVNAGPAAARNTGIKASSGDIVAFIDSDDRWPRGKLQHQLLPLLINEQIDVVFSKIRVFSQKIEDVDSAHNSQNLFYSIQLGCLLVKRHLFNSVGLFDESLLYSEDQDWFLRVREQNTAMVKVDIEGLHYRSHPESLTHDGNRKNDFGLVHVLKRSLDRRRNSKTSKPVTSLLSLADIPEWEARRIH